MYAPILFHFPRIFSMIQLIHDFFFAPFSYLFLKRALIACFILSLGSAPVGIFLVLRRMSLMGDALSHAILPGVAVGFLLTGLSLPMMSLGGLLAGLVVALLAGLVSRFTLLREDASFAGFFLLSLACGVMIVSTKGSNVDLIHVLFGTILSVDVFSLIMMAGVTTFTLTTLAFIYRAFILECFDPIFFKSVGGRGGLYHLLFLFLVVANLVVAFQALGTLMSLGLMMIPAISARLWARDIMRLCGTAFLISFFSGYLGLLISYHGSFPSGPSIILIAGIFYVISILFGKYGSFRTHFFS